ncbi:MAG: aspartate/glutamate racemase family protein [Chloroflexi bacterium]|nr:aspartate/glutamate racemase family protein [Chloroflexota bacterium]
MRRTVGLVHAVQPSIPPLREAFAAHLPDVRVLHLLDEALLAEVERLGGVRPSLVRRLTTLIALLEQAQAEVVLLACTAYSGVVDQVRAQCEVPVLPIDAVLVGEAVQRGPRLGVLGTVEAGVRVQESLLRAEAERRGIPLDIRLVIRPEAFAALNAGDGARHDTIVLEEAQRLAPQVDALVLAQASMARLVPQFPADLAVPVLASPTLAVAKVREVMRL